MRSQSGHGRIMQDLEIRSLMTKAVKCTTPTTPLSQVVQTMKDNRHSCMVVVENNRPVGIVTERDIVKRFLELQQQGKDYDPPAGAVMSAPPVTVAEHTQLFEALVLAKSNQIRHLPVVDGSGELVGLVTQTDLVSAHFRVLETQTEILERAVANRTQELMDVNRKLREMSLEDPLLKIGNRRSMEVDLNFTHASALRYQRPYAVVLFDVDHFKLYNDHYGHVAGDEALKEVAGLLKESVRKTDRVYRYGGEELLVLLPETSREGAKTLAHRMIYGVMDKKIAHEKHPLKVVTISGGLSGPDEAAGQEPWHDVVQRADCALYKAKGSGRNRVVSLFYSDLLREQEPARLSA
ncbi:MAG: diguanylate cyclase [Deltaproteobacteria bacterium]|nr:diguanylate cyclase [Deltaproteobacteria bacterium]